MRHLLAATCLTPAALLVSVPVSSETLISTARTTPIQTSTANGGAPDDVHVATAGSIKPGSGTAVTLDSNNKVTNEGTIQITGANDAVGILAQPGVTGSIANSGTITIDEDYTATDSDSDGDVDGPFAQGSNRFGIRVAPGGTFTGDINQTGTISVEGNNSAAIAVDSALAGNLASGGTINLTGDSGVGIRAGAVSGKVAISGTVNVLGKDDVGVALDGDIGGALTIQGAISATGYRSTTKPADTSKLDADDLLQGGSALRVSGNVAGGILFDIPPTDKDANNADEDADGIPDASEGSASVTAYGAAPATQIGSTSRDIAIGAVAGTAAAGNGIVNKGIIDGEGVYSGVSATGLSIGGLGGKVNVAGGVMNSGAIKANSLDSNATALRLGAGTTALAVTNSGTIAASGGAASSSSVQAVSIEAGATVTSLANSGSITARLNGADGNATAIADHAGNLASIQNSGTIAVALATGGTATAIDLSANSSGATVSQVKPTSTTAAAPSITGDIRFGTGNDSLSLAAGTFTGAARFGGGADALAMSGDAVHTGGLVFGAGSDKVSLSGTSQHVGAVDFGGGADTLTIADTASFSGAVSNARNLAVTVSGGALDLSTGTAAIGSLDVASAGSITVTVDGAAGSHTLYDVAGQASFAQGSKVNLALTSLSGSEGTYQVLHAGTLAGASNLVTTGAAIPYLFKTSLGIDQAAGNISLTVARKSATELGLNRSGAAVYDAVYAAAAADSQIGGVFLHIQDADSFQKTYRQMLPDHAGGLFAMVTEGDRALGRVLSDPHSPMADLGSWGFWVDQAAWGSSKAAGDTAPWKETGWGLAGGAEFKTGGAGRFGLSLSYLSGFDKSEDNEINANGYELAAYWRADWKGLHAYARAGGAYVNFDSVRNFVGTLDPATVTRKAAGSWNGWLLSATGGASYELKSGRLSIRPAVNLDYYRLKENGWSETGGGTGFDLSIDSRSSDALAANATLNLGYDINQASQAGDPYLRFELEGGRREQAGGSVGATTAHFEGGQDFTLLADDLRSSWIGRARLLGGTGDFQALIEGGAERENDRTAISARVALQVRF